MVKRILALHAIHFHYNKDKLPNGKGSTSSQVGRGQIHQQQTQLLGGTTCLTSLALQYLSNSASFAFYGMTASGDLGCSAATNTRHYVNTQYEYNHNIIYL